MDTQKLLNDVEMVGHKQLYNDNSKLNPDVYALYVEYVKTGKYPYLSDVRHFIVQRMELPECVNVEHGNLQSHIYYAADRYRREKEREYVGKMEAEGWKLLRSLEEARELAKRGNKIQAIVEATHDWMSTRKKTVLRPIIDVKDRPFFLLPKCTRRGYYADAFLYPGSDGKFFYKTR